MVHRVALGCALLLAGCGDDAGGDGGAGDAAIPDAAGMDGGDVDAGGTDAGGRPDAGLPDAAPDTGPRVRRVAWMHAMPCDAAAMRDVTFTVTVEDPDTPAASLTFTGSVAGCTGEISAAVSTLSCTGEGDATGMVRVRDPEDGFDFVVFTVRACADGFQNF
jgi:hypothetical protein